MLHSFGNGEIQTPATVESGLYAWAFGKLTVPVMVTSDTGAIEQTTLAEVIASNKATGVHNHDKFPAGEPPAFLSPTGTRCFVATSNPQETRACIDACKQASKVQLMWKVKVQGGKVVPSQLVLVSKGKVTIKASEGGSVCF